MKIFMHRNGSRYAYNSNEKLKLKDIVTGRTYFLGSVFWDTNGSIENHGRISVYPTQETAAEMAVEYPNYTVRYHLNNPIEEFAERFEPADVWVGDWFAFDYNGQSLIGQLNDEVLSTTRLYRLKVGDEIYNIHVNECVFYATREVPENVINNINLRIPQINDIVCPKNDITKIGKIHEVTWRDKMYVVDYFDNTHCIGEYEPKELTVMSKEQAVTWGSFSGAVEEAATPRVRDGISGGTHQIINNIRTSFEMRNSSIYGVHVSLLGIPEVMVQYCPQLKQSVQTKRFKSGDWIVDISTEDHTTPQGVVEKTWYKAISERNKAHEMWLMQALYNHNKIYNTVLASIPAVTSVEGVLTPEQSEEAAELLTATQRIEAAAARYRSEASVREAARATERARQQQEAELIRIAEETRRAEETRLREAEEAKKSIWNYHTLKPKVQNP